MNSPMQIALGDDWARLPPALQAHHRFGTTTDTGHLDIEYPSFMQPSLTLLGIVGALVNRRGQQVPTVVEKEVLGEHQHWRRTIRYPDGKPARFDSIWIHAGGNELIEFVNPLLGLQMAVWVDEGRLHYRGVCFVLKLGRLRLPIPEWLLGHTSIVEEAIDAQHFAMDFRLTHPLLGQVFRYAGAFSVESKEAARNTDSDRCQ